jgi:hypothetical protein
MEYTHEILLIRVDYFSWLGLSYRVMNIRELLRNEKKKARNEHMPFLLLTFFLKLYMSMMRASPHI